MTPTDDTPYYLPDGTLVIASHMSSDEWLLEAEDGTPLFYTSNGRLYRLEYHEDEDGYRLMPSDLTFDDLTLAD